MKITSDLERFFEYGNIEQEESMYFKRITAMGNLATTLRLLSCMALFSLGVVLFGPDPLLAQSGITDEPFPYEDFKPMPIPEWTPPLTETKYGDGDFVRFDMETNKESLVSLPLHEGNRNPTVSTDNNLHQSIPSISYGVESVDSLKQESPNPAPPTGLHLVESPEQYPWRVNVKLLITDQNGDQGACSGVLIDPMWVLTAGHCIFLWQNDGSLDWAEQIRVVPAYHDGEKPYGHAQAVRLYSHRKWTELQDFNYDMGMIQLDWPVGSVTGWHYYGTENTDSFFRNSWFFNPGYPGEYPFDGEKMYYWEGKYNEVEEYRIGRELEGFRGQSGSGSYVKHANDLRIVYAVASHIGNGSTWYTRITDWWFDYIDTSISESVPSQVDLMPLAVEVSDSETDAGQAIGVGYLLHNYSSAIANEDIEVEIYLSRDNEITQSDILLDRHTQMLPLGAMGSVVVSISDISIPQDSDGQYWIGVMLPLSDADNTNNQSNGQQAAAVFINPVKPDPPTSIHAQSYPDRIELSWNPVTNAAHYNVWRAIAGEGINLNIGSTASPTYVDESAERSVTYIYFVEAVSGSGVVSGPSQEVQVTLRDYRIFLPQVSLVIY